MLEGKTLLTRNNDKKIQKMSVVSENLTIREVTSKEETIAKKDLTQKEKTSKKGNIAKDDTSQGNNKKKENLKVQKGKPAVNLPDEKAMFLLSVRIFRQASMQFPGGLWSFK